MVFWVSNLTALRALLSWNCVLSDPNLRQSLARVSMINQLIYLKLKISSNHLCFLYRYYFWSIWIRYRILLLLVLIDQVCFLSIPPWIWKATRCFSLSWHWSRKNLLLKIGPGLSLQRKKFAFLLLNRFYFLPRLWWHFRRHAFWFVWSNFVYPKMSIARW